MARQRSAPAALSIQSLERLITPPATPSSPQRSEFWGSPPQKSPTHRNPRKKPHKGYGAATSLAGLSRGMKHVASEPQLCALGGSIDHAGVDRSTVEPLKLTAHTVSVHETLPDTEPPIATPSTAAAASPRQPDTAPAAPHSGLSAQQPKLCQRPKAVSAALGDALLSPNLAAKIAEAVHKDDATVLDGLLLPSLSSKRELSATSLSTIAESGSDVGSSQANLDQVAEKLCELQAADSLQSDDTDAKTDRSSFEFATRKDPFSSSPAQVSGFPSPAKPLRSSPLGQTSATPGSPAQPCQLASAAAEPEAPVLENGDRSAAQASRDRGEACSSSAPAVNTAHSSASSCIDSGTSGPAAPCPGSAPLPVQKSFSTADSALFAPTALKLRIVSQEPPGDSDIKASGRKLQQIPSDSEIVIHVSPGQGHETPFTSGPCKGGPDLCPLTVPPSPPGEAPTSARAAAASAMAGEDTPPFCAEGLPPRPFSPPTWGESSSGLPVDSALEQRDSSSSTLSPTSKAAADVGNFSPRRLPPKLTHTRIGGLGDGPRLSGDSAPGSGDRPHVSGDKPPIPGDLSGRPSSERPSAERPRPSKDGKLIGRGKLFRVTTPTPPPFPARTLPQHHASRTMSLLHMTRRMTHAYLNTHDRRIKLLLLLTCRMTHALGAQSSCRWQWGCLWKTLPPPRDRRIAP